MLRVGKQHKQRQLIMTTQLEHEMVFSLANPFFHLTYTESWILQMKI